MDLVANIETDLRKHFMADTVDEVLASHIF